jgi:transcriptional regulator with XRE-family HTH domain
MEVTVAKRIVALPLPPAQPLLDAATLGQFVRARRTQSGLTMHSAAALCGVAVGTLEKIERATGDVRLSSILTVCSMLGITVTIEAKGSK